MSFVATLFTCLMLEQGALFAPEGAKTIRTERNGRYLDFQYFDTISRIFDALPVFGYPGKLTVLITTITPSTPTLHRKTSLPAAASDAHTRGQRDSMWRCCGGHSAAPSARHASQHFHSNFCAAGRPQRREAWHTHAKDAPQQHCRGIVCKRQTVTVAHMHIALGHAAWDIIPYFIPFPYFIREKKSMETNLP
jgi:hypothetical protein